MMGTDICYIFITGTQVTFRREPTRVSEMLLNPNNMYEVNFRNKKNYTYITPPSLKPVSVISQETYTKGSRKSQ